MDKKEFALSQIAPYFKDPTTCGYENGNCLYITSDGKMCVAGKNMIDPSKWERLSSMSAILENRTQEEVLKPDVINILTSTEWRKLQAIHDAIATKHMLEYSIRESGLFSMDELIEAAKNL